MEKEATSRLRIVVRALQQRQEIPPIEVSSAAAMVVDVNVSRLFDTDALVMFLQVEVEHEHYAPAVVRVPVDPRIAGSARSSAPHVIPARVQLVEAAVVHGQVIGPQGAPRQGVTVGILSLGTGVPRVVIDRKVTDSDGRWRLRVGIAGSFLVAFADGGMLPEARSIDLSPGTRVNLGVVRMRREVTLTGSVRLRGRPAPGAVVEVVVPGGVRLPLGRSVQWTERGVRPGTLTTIADETGSYALPGLLEGEVRARIVGLAGHPVHWSLSKTTLRTVRAPSADVEFDIDARELVVCVYDDREPAANARVQLILDDPDAGHAGPDGKYATFVPSGATGSVRVDLDGYQPAVAEFGPITSDHPIRIDLQPWPGAVELELKPVNSQQRIARAGVRLRGVGGQASGLSETRYLTTEDGALRFNTAPGVWNAVIRPGGPFVGGSAYWLEVSTRLETPASGATSMSVPVVEGGRLCVGVRGSDGQFVPARCRVLREGREVPVRFAFRSAWGVVSGLTTFHGGLAIVGPPLPAGRYTIEVASAGYAAQCIEVVVEVGKTTDVEMQLSSPR